MGKTSTLLHHCGYPLVRDEVIDSVDVGHGLHLPAELRETLIRATSMLSVATCRSERCSTGMMEPWIWTMLNLHNTRVKQCPKCGEVLPLSEK